MKLSRSVSLAVFLWSFLTLFPWSARAVSYPDAATFLWGNSAVNAPAQTSFVSGTGMPYRLLLPRNYDANVKYPVVIFMHGYGQRGTDNTAQLNSGANGAMAFVSTAAPDNQALYPCIFVCPQVSDQWTNKGPQFTDMINTLKTQYSVDDDRISLTGLSFGGLGSFAIVKALPNTFNCLVEFNGGRGDMTIENLPIWIFHAENDDQIACGASDGAVKTLRDRGIPVIYTRYQTGGHGIWSSSYKLPELTQWVFAQRRGQPMQSIPALQVLTTTTGTTLTVTGTTLLAPNMGVSRVGWCRSNFGGGISGTDAQTDGTTTFTSAAANFTGTDLTGYRLTINKRVSGTVPDSPYLYDVKQVFSATTLQIDRASSGTNVGTYYLYKPGGNGLINPASGTTTNNWQTWSIETILGNNQIVHIIGELVLSSTGNGGRTTYNYPITINGYTAPSGDKTPPTLTVLSPTTRIITTTSPAIDLNGTFSDNVAVTAVDVVNSRTGFTGPATILGSSWAISSVALNAGPNTITVTAKDAQNNKATAYFLVYYNAGSGTDATSPVIGITGPTTASTYSTTNATITLTGTASDNVGVTQVIWTNNTLNTNGPAVGTATWSADISLTSGTNQITMTAQDAAANAGTDTITVVRAVNQAPTVNAGTDQTITLPATATLSGTASDDGLPSNALTTTWSKVSGTGTVTFSDTASLTSTATFSAAGTYTLRLTANDGALTATDDVVVTVNPAVSGSTSQTINLDFGLNGYKTTDTGWNNIVSGTVGSGTNNCVDSTGAATGVAVSITQAFSGPGDNSTSPPSTPYPQTAMRDYIFSQTMPAKLKFTGLDTAATYKVTVYAYRAASGSDRVGKYTVSGESLTLNAANNLSTTISFTGKAPATDGSLELTVEPNAGSTYGYLNVLVLEKEIPPPPPMKISLDFGLNGYKTTDTGWNNIVSGTVGSGTNNCVDSLGAPTGVGVTITQAFLGPGDNSTSPPSTPYPQTAMRDYIFSQTAPSKLRFTGLEPGGTYRITVYAYRATGATDRVGKYTVGAQSLTLNAANNLSNTIVFTGAAPASDGSLELTVEPNTGSGYAYLSIVILERETGLAARSVKQGTVGSVEKMVTWESRRPTRGLSAVDFIPDKTASLGRTRRAAVETQTNFAEMARAPLPAKMSRPILL